MLLDVGLECSWMFVGGETKLLSESLFRLETRQAREDFFIQLQLLVMDKTE